MKRFLTILLTTLALTGLLCVTASASSFDGPAAELSAIGMLRGGAGGFDLDKAPTRAQAAIMLVRLYGAEDEAQAAYDAGELKCPFADVNGTAAPYVAWLADKGLASGTSESTFGASNPCTAKAYTIFLLRALGYQDNVDFTSANAQELALGIGLLDTSLFTGSFLRDDLVAMTYQALGADLKDGSTYLLASLIQNGAIEAAAAKPITDKVEAYRALNASGADAAQGMDAGVNAKMDMTVGVKGRADGEPIGLTQKMEADVQGSIQMVLEGTPQMAMDMTIAMNDGTETQTQKMEYWLKDGVTYVRSGGASYRMDTGADMESLTALMEQSSGQSGPAMLPFVESITSKASGGDTVYTLRLNDAFGKMMNGILSQVMEAVPAELDMDMEMTLDTGAITYTVGSGGKLKDAAIDVAMTASVDASQGADVMSVSLSLNMDMTMEIKAMGGDVKITYPNFSGFEEIIGGADGPTGILGTAVA